MLHLSTYKLSRRTALRGLGVSLALPWLEATWAVAKAATAAETAPIRMGFIFVPNGVVMNKWRPKSEGYGFDLSPTLQPLSPFKDDMLVLSGLTHDKGRANGDGPGDHARSASVFLTGSQPRKTDGEKIRSGISVDQMAAKHIGHKTRFSSLELGVDQGRSAGNCDSGYSCAYSSNISWSSESMPMGKEVNPRLVFERLFAGGKPSEVDKSQQQRSALQQSVLDFVAEDAKRLQARLGRNDNQKLDEYLTGVREIERRMEGKTSQPADVDVDYKIPDGVPGDFKDHIRMMCDMMVLAYQTDTTRVATMMFANAGDNKNYRKIGVPDGHHDLSHHRDDPEKLEKISKIDRFNIEQLAYFIQRLKSIREGERTLLDNTMICYGSGLSDGNRHNHDDLPMLVIGSGGGTIDTGRHIRYDLETPMCNLYISLLERMDVHVPFIGDSTGKLPGLTT